MFRMKNKRVILGAQNSEGKPVKKKKKLDVYIIEDKVGQGSYGIVYKAYKRENKEKFYAIKCVNKQKVSN